MQLLYAVQASSPYITMVSIANSRVKLVQLTPLFYAVAVAPLLVVAVGCVDEGLKGHVMYRVNLSLCQLILLKPTIIEK